MPADTRAATRAARERAKAKGINYTTALSDVQAIQQLAVDNDWDYDEAEAFYDDPANELLCEDCGWTVGMVCPECPKGCGCVTNCSGWRHWGLDAPSALRDDDDPADDEYECDCGAIGPGSGPYDECVCA